MTGALTATRTDHAPRAAWNGRAWSCAVRLVVDDPRVLRPAAEDLVALLEPVDAVASRFRELSALSLANRRAGRPTPVPPLLVDLVDAALDAAARTGGATDPTLGTAIAALGYDADIDVVRARDAAETRPVPAPRPDAWLRVRPHRQAGLLTVPRGVALDLGATAKAWTADEAARTLAARYATGVLVELGGDVAVAGGDGVGWCVHVAERPGGTGEPVQLRRGGLATSTTTLRTWTRGGRTQHHVLDPRTGHPVAGPWRTASVAAGSTLAANTMATAALVWGGRAVDRLSRLGVAARLVDHDGAITTTAGWPVDSVATR